MPILSVEIIGQLQPEKRDGLSQRLADATSKVFDSRPQGTWVRIRHVDETDYAENGGPPSGLPVLVSVLLATPPAVDARRDQAQQDPVPQDQAPQDQAQQGRLMLLVR